MSVPYDFSLIDRGYSHTEDSIELPRHRWYSYKEGFSPTLVQHAIQSTGIQPHELVIDPFNGSGTVSLHCSQTGQKCLGYEINPFSAFIARTKQIDLRNNDLKNIGVYKDAIIKGIKKGRKSPLLKFSTFSECGSNDKWLFNSSVLNAFNGGIKSLEPYAYMQIFPLLKLALISSAMENCNAKKDGKCLRYKSNWELSNYDATSFSDGFQAALDSYIDDIKIANVRQRSRIIQGDCRNLTRSTRTRFRLCVTSPPYLNSFDYTDIYRPELFLGDFLGSQADFRNLKQATLRSHIISRNGKLGKRKFGHLYQSAIDGLLNAQEILWHKDIPLMVQSYFDDIALVLGNLKRKAVIGAELWMVVGNSAYANINIPTDLILADIGAKTGWYLKEIKVLRYLHKRGSKYSPDVQQLRESVIILTSEPR